MKITGHLVPYPDPGAFDLMSDHLEQNVQATESGIIVVRVQLPRMFDGRPGKTPDTVNLFARKRLELIQRHEDKWEPVWEETSDSAQEIEEVSVTVSKAGLLRCKLTNMSGAEAQFSLECTFIPD